MALNYLSIRCVMMRCTYKWMMTWMYQCNLRVLSVFYSHACQQVPKFTRAYTLSWRVTMSGIQTLSTFVTSGKYLNYLKIIRGTFIRPNMILCTLTQSQHPIMSMICIYIMTLLLTKPYFWKFLPVYTIERSLYCKNQCYNNSNYTKWNTISSYSPSRCYHSDRM